MVASLVVAHGLVWWQMDGFNPDRGQLDNRRQRVVLCALVFGTVVVRAVEQRGLVLGTLVLGTLVVCTVVLCTVVLRAVVLGFVVRVPTTGAWLSARTRTVLLSIALISIASVAAVNSFLSADKQLISRPVTVITWLDKRNLLYGCEMAVLRCASARFPSTGEVVVWPR